MDSNGKIWAWGYTSGNYIGIDEYQKILNGISNNQTTPICLSEIEDSVYYKAYNKGIKFVEIYGAGNGSGLCLLDNYGKLWGVNINTKNVNPSDILQCISDVKTFELNANYQLIENYKIQKVKIWSGQIFVQDNQGDSWLFSSSSTTKLSVKKYKRCILLWIY